ncbi:unnamed protein product [Periconia digitata]|uniref:Tat pathway signal sequence protein n=1 Tax=Periconia digitata TaxID=1303443 RepID=A0A9W4XFR6_9PLEO|nr:unnamed protein product [Periconia digitata]
MNKTKYSQLRNSEDWGTEGGVSSSDSQDLKPPRFTRRLQHTILYSLLITTNIVFLSLWLTAKEKNGTDYSSCVRPQLTFSPATEAIRYEKKRLWRDIDGPNPFTGVPRPELDKAWHDLLEPMTIKVTAEELEKFSEGDTSIALRDGSGYIAEMAAYHELHCNKRIRRYIFFDYYYHNLTEEEQRTEDTHIDHCLEYWRESVMCRGDTTMGTFYWRESDGYPTSRVYTDNECVDWTAFDTWSRKRMVDMSDRSILEDSPFGN